MKLSIIVPDQLVTIDGVVVSGIDLSSLSPRIRVVQWDSVKQKGHVEFDNDDLDEDNEFMGNSIITELSTAMTIIRDAAILKRDEEAETPLEETLATYALLKRRAKVEGGIISGTYGPLWTDKTTRDTIADLIAAIEQDMIDPPINYKGANGFVQLDLATIKAIAKEIAQHVQDCFTKEMQVLAGIENGTITTRSEVDQAFA